MINVQSASQLTNNSASHIGYRPVQPIESAPGAEADLYLNEFSPLLPQEVVEHITQIIHLGDSTILVCEISQ